MNVITRTTSCLLIVSSLNLLGHSSRADVPLPMERSFTYQGYFEDNGQPANGQYDLKFTLNFHQTDPDSTLTTAYVDDINVVNGRFTATLDLGDTWYGAHRWLGISIRPGSHPNADHSPATYTNLNPRQNLTATPYALAAGRALSLRTPMTIEDAIGNPLLSLNNTSTSGWGLSLTAGQAGTADGLALLATHRRGNNAQLGTPQYGVMGFGDSTNGLAAVHGFHATGPKGSLGTPSVGVLGNATTTKTAIRGEHVSTGNWGEMGAPEAGVYGGGLDSAPGVFGAGDETGVFGDSTHGSGVTGQSSFGWAVRGLGKSYFSNNVGIGTASPAFLLHVNGSAGKPGGGSWSSASDARLKTNIQPLTQPLEQLLALRGVTYEYPHPQVINELPGTQIGMIAQEVETVFPQWVNDGPDGFKRLTFRGFEALTVEAVRELKQKHEAQLQQLQDENAALRARIERIEALLQADR